MPESIMTKKEVETFLSISSTTLHNYVTKGLLNPLGISRRVYFKTADIMKALERGQSKSLTPLSIKEGSEKGDNV